MKAGRSTSQASTAGCRTITLTADQYAKKLDEYSLTVLPDHLRYKEPKASTAWLAQVSPRYLEPRRKPEPRPLPVQNPHLNEKSLQAQVSPRYLEPRKTPQQPAPPPKRTLSPSARCRYLEIKQDDGPTPREVVEVRKEHDYREHGWTNPSGRPVRLTFEQQQRKYRHRQEEIEEKARLTPCRPRRTTSIVMDYVKNGTPIGRMGATTPEVVRGEGRYGTPSRGGKCFVAGGNAGNSKLLKKESFVLQEQAVARKREAMRHSVLHADTRERLLAGPLRSSTPQPSWSGSLRGSRSPTPLAARSRTPPAVRGTSPSPRHHAVPQHSEEMRITSLDRLGDPPHVPDSATGSPLVKPKAAGRMMFDGVAVPSVSKTPARDDEGALAPAADPTADAGPQPADERVSVERALELEMSEIER